MTRSGHTRAGLAGVLLLVVLGAAACGGGSTAPNVASLHPTTSASEPSQTSVSPSAGAAPQTKGPGAAFEAFAQCMRSHGVPQFPDPTNNGTSLRIGPGTGVNANSTQFRSAQASCGHLLPDAGGALGPTLTPAEQLDYLKAAACVRAHGIASFPDPVIKNGHVKFVLPPGTLDANTTLLQQAISICRKLIPAGLPYSS